MNLSAKLSLFDPALPLEQAATIPALWYTDAEVWEAERQAVFGRHWLAAGRADQVAQPGQFFTIDIAGQPLVVVRGEDGVLRGFYNVCRHKAARVACEACGTASKFRCRYHGWTYDLAGALKGVPEFDGVADFRREDNGLLPVRVAAWGPLVFVHLGRPATSLEQFLAPVPERLQAFRLDRYRFAERRVYDLACNWKVFVDNYLDGGYHVNTIHLSLAGVLDYKSYRTDVFEHASIQSTGMKQPDTTDDASAAAVRAGAQAAYAWVWPNFMLNVYEAALDTNLVLPLGPDRCRVIFDFYFPPEQEADFQRGSIAVADRIQAEDIEISEDVQKGLHSQAYSTGRYSVRREIGIHHFHLLLTKSLREWNSS
jgi:choline monooxygenase